MADAEVITGAIALFVGGMISPATTALWRKLSGSQYATRKDCTARHERLKDECESCRKATSNTICAIQHEGVKNLKLMRLIAMQVKVPMEDLKEFL